MERYAVKNIYGKMGAGKQNEVLKVRVPGSKSITNRALLIATLAEGVTKLSGVLFSDDSRHFLDCVQKLGIKTEVDEAKREVILHGCDGRLPLDKASINVGSAGTAARFLAATLGVSQGEYHMDSSDQMKKRPMAPLLNSLKDLGCEVEFLGEEGHFPFIIKGHGFGKDEISVNIDSSSQFLSALLIASVLSDKDFKVNVLGSHGMAYIDMTVKMMEQFGAKVSKEENNAIDGKDCENEDACSDASCKRRLSYLISADQNFKSQDYPIEPDASAAAYFYAMAPILGIPVCVPGVRFDSLQGDVEFIRLLEKMGCKAVKVATLTNATEHDMPNTNVTGLDGLNKEDIVLLPPSTGSYYGIDVDMSACSDQAITMAVVAIFANSPTTIRGIGHIKLQESDRLTAIVTELNRMGIKTEHGEDFIKIYPGTPKPAEIETYEDHRMAMGFSLAGLRSDGIVIKDPLCCRKTFEEYFEVLDKICQ